MRPPTQQRTTLIELGTNAGRVGQHTGLSGDVLACAGDSPRSLHAPHLDDGQLSLTNTKSTLVIDIYFWNSTMSGLLITAPTLACYGPNARNLAATAGGGCVVLRGVLGGCLGLQLRASSDGSLTVLEGERGGRADGKIVVGTAVTACNGVSLTSVDQATALFTECSVLALNLPPPSPSKVVATGNAATDSEATQGREQAEVRHVCWLYNIAWVVCDGCGRPGFMQYPVRDRDACCRIVANTVIFACTLTSPFPSHPQWSQLRVCLCRRSRARSSSLSSAASFRSKSKSA